MPRGAELEGKKFNKLLVLEKTNKRIGSNVVWKCKCDCGNFTEATTNDLNSGHKKSCGCLQKEKASILGKSKIKNLKNMVFGELTVLEPTQKRIDGRAVWKCRCSCGKIIELSSHRLLVDGTKSCGCKIPKSKGEDKIIQILSENNIPYEREKIYKDLTNNGKCLRFDFYVNNEYLIEYDGIQHFIKDCGFGADLENIIYRDNLKNKYCLSKNIPLIRIPYTRYNELTINDLLLNTTNFLIKERKYK